MYANSLGSIYCAIPVKRWHHDLMKSINRSFNAHGTYSRWNCNVSCRLFCGTHNGKYIWPNWAVLHAHAMFSNGLVCHYIYDLKVTEIIQPFSFSLQFQIDLQRKLQLFHNVSPVQPLSVGSHFPPWDSYPIVFVPTKLKIMKSWWGPVKISSLVLVVFNWSWTFKTFQFSSAVATVERIEISGSTKQSIVMPDGFLMGIKWTKFLTSVRFILDLKVASFKLNGIRIENRSQFLFLTGTYNRFFLIFGLLYEKKIGKLKRSLNQQIEVIGVIYVNRDLLVLIQKYDNNINKFMTTFGLSLSLSFSLSFFLSFSIYLFIYTIWHIFFRFARWFSSTKLIFF